ncbi:MAG: histidine phosphatase family protein [Lachnospiraceae bacterium]|nr:histidine phosphatase family protein [Lachnospiraceae bacterium]
MNIYLARHGTTEWNAARRIQGRTDIELDKTGIEMARQTGLRLSEMGIIFDHVFSSPLKRAFTTAELLSHPPGSSGPGSGSCDAVIHTDDRLTELCFGDFEGRNVEEMLADQDCAFRYFKADPKRYNDEIIAINRVTSTNSLPETLTELLKRSSEFVRDIIEPLAVSNCGNSQANVLISGHGAVNKAILMYFSHSNDLNYFWGSGLQPNCGINKITCTGNDSGEIIYEVQDKCLVLYDSNLEKNLRKLL